jgi:glycosyltransferase involved in cell wall biosynthesis
LLQALRAAAGPSQTETMSVEDELASRSPRAQRLAAADPPPGLRTLWVDVTAIAQHDLRSGVQRVTRNLMKPLLERGVQGWRIEPVYLNQGLYWTARALTANWLQMPPLLRDALPAEQLAEPVAGDAFFGLDLVTDGVHQHEPRFRQWSQRGVRLSFMVHDLLPLTHPHWFPAASIQHFKGWWGTVSRVADALVCNSQFTAGVVRHHLMLQGQGPKRRAPLVQAIGLGAQLSTATDLQLQSQLSPQECEWIESVPVDQQQVLMVGTVEPRKGHPVVLSAMERLWEQGATCSLVILGRSGWMVDDFAHRLRSHPELGRRLHWLDGASDELVSRLYQRASLLVMASYAEGYGLPVVEALAVGLPVLARDIPVFREVGCNAAEYWNIPQAEQYPDADAQALVQAIKRRLAHDAKAARVPLLPSAAIGWVDCTQRAVGLIMEPQATLLGRALDGAHSPTRGTGHQAV